MEAVKEIKFSYKLSSTNQDVGIANSDMKLQQKQAHVSNVPQLLYEA